MPTYTLCGKITLSERGTLYTKPIYTGSREEVMVAFKHNKYKAAQLYIEDEHGKIVAIEVHREMLWLANVPPPQYFTPPAKSEFCMGGA